MKQRKYWIVICVGALGVGARAGTGHPELEISRSLIGADVELTCGFWMQKPLGDCEDDDLDLRDHDGFTVCATGRLTGRQ